MDRIFIKKNGKMSLDKKNDIEKFENVNHLCWEGECVNGCSSKDCAKIANVKLHPLDEYSFVLKGAEIRDDSGNVIRQRISKCENYSKPEPKILSKEELKRLKKLRESIRIYYFNTETYYEALSEQRKLRNDLFKKK